MKRFIFTVLLLMINAITISLLFMAPNFGEALFIFIFFFVLLVAYVLSFSKTTVNSFFVKKSGEILGDILISCGCFFCMYQIAMAPITGEIIGGARGISTHLTFQNSPDLFLTFILIYLCGSVVFGRMTWDALKNHWVSVKQYRSNANKL